jgi:hypothetical protein
MVAESMTDTTILYYTDNSLNKDLLELCQRQLIKSAGNNKILSITQKPIDFGENICVGNIGKSLISLWTQQIEGMKKATTRYIAFAEHDCIYSPDHFNFIPSSDEIFYYNANLWYMHCCDGDTELKGLYSWGAKRQPYNEFKVPQSQLIANRELALVAYEERLELIKNYPLSRSLPAEPGVMKTSAIEKLQEEGNIQLLNWAKKWTAKHFSTTIPNLDIQHGANYSRRSRPRSGKKRCASLPYWGTVDDVLGGKNI